MANEITIPILPCSSINDTLNFYVALGFEITYQQTRPNSYACVRRGGIELHFFSMREYEPSNSYSTCFVLVADVDELYQAFADGLRQHFGRLPVAGIPRITRLRNKSGGIRGFNVIDPGGNWIRVGQKVESLENESEPLLGNSTKLSRAIRAADLLADFKGDYAAAADMLDGALTGAEAGSSIERVQALVARAALAITLGDLGLAGKMLNDMRNLSLADSDRAQLVDELQRANDLERMLE